MKYKYIHYIKIGSAYQLTQPYKTKTRIRPRARIFFRFTILEMDGTLTLKKGFCFDGASGAFDTDTILRGAAGHDAKYELIRQGLLPMSDRDIADKELQEDCLEDGIIESVVKWQLLKVDNDD